MADIVIPHGESPLPIGLNECFAKFFADEDKRTPGDDVYEEIFTSPLLFPLQRRRELAHMMRTARSIEPQVVYEIGADKAGGLYHWCKSLPTVRRVIACEIRGTPYAELFEKAFPHIDFLWLAESSYDAPALKKIKNWLGEDRIDCTFIDGDKSNFDTDFDCVLPFMNPQGIVFMHDIQDEAPRRGYNKSVKKGYPHTEFIDISESHEAVARSEAGEEPRNVHEMWLRHWKGRSAGVGIIYLTELQA